MRDGSPRFPGYDVLAKRDTPSWNEQTRRAIDARLAITEEPRFFGEAEWRTLRAICDRVIRQPAMGSRVPIAALVDRKMEQDQRDGFRHAIMPPQREAWRRGLRAVDAEARARFGGAFHDLPPARQDEVLSGIEAGEAHTDTWGDMPPKTFFKARLLHDIAASYYAHPFAWNEIGFGGPASPRGYVRMDFNRRDPWEAVEQTAAKQRDA